METDDRWWRPLRSSGGVMRVGGGRGCAESEPASGAPGWSLYRTCFGMDGTVRRRLHSCCLPGRRLALIDIHSSAARSTGLASCSVRAPLQPCVRQSATSWESSCSEVANAFQLATVGLPALLVTSYSGGHTAFRGSLQRAWVERGPHGWFDMRCQIPKPNFATPTAQRRSAALYSSKLELL